MHSSKTICLFATKFFLATNVFPLSQKPLPTCCICAVIHQKLCPFVHFWRCNSAENSQLATKRILCLAAWQKTLANLPSNVLKLNSKNQKQKVLQVFRLKRADCGENSVSKGAKCSLFVGKTKRRIFAKVVLLGLFR